MSLEARDAPGVVGQGEAQTPSSATKSDSSCKTLRLHKSFAAETGPGNCERTEDSSWLSKLQTKSFLCEGSSSFLSPV